MAKDDELLNRGKTDMLMDKIFAVGFEDAIYLKRIDMLFGKLILISTNPDYPPVAIDDQGQSKTFSGVSDKPSG